MNDARPEGIPYLPPAAPVAAPGQPAGTPFLPAAQPVAAPPAPEPAAFDAKAMVESQKRVVANPAYGAIPKATPESIEAARALRAKAQRKRRRNKALGWSVALGMLGGIGVAGWFAYQAYQDDQEQLDADRAAAQADGSSAAPGALTPLGNQQEVIDALEDVNSGGARPSAGALGDIVDEAQAAVDSINGTSSAELTLLDVRPRAVARLGSRLENLAGYERHVVVAAELAADSPDEYARFVTLMQAQPQIDGRAPTFDVLPDLAPGEIGFAIALDGERVIQAIVLSDDPEIHVDYAPE